MRGSPTAPSGLKSELDQAALDGVAHQPGDVVDVELLHDPVAVRLCGLEADAEKTRDRFGGLAFGNQLQDLALARRKRVLGLVALVHVRVDQRRGHPGADIDRVARDLPDRAEQVLRGFVAPRVVPRRGCEAMCTDPPSAPRRSRMPTNPSPVPPSSLFSAKPTPSSRTVQDTRSLVWRTSMFAVLARACLITLLSASCAIR